MHTIIILNTNNISNRNFQKKYKLEYVVLVDTHDNPLGIMEKLEAHKKGVLHRAFSIFIFNSEGEMLLQKRANSKYHSAGLWTNTCCSHPRPDENCIDAANRRLKEEMGINSSLKKIVDFTYKAKLNNNLTEHEYDHVFIGSSDSTPILNSEEAEAFQYVSITELDKLLAVNSEDYTEWFKLIFPLIKKYVAENGLLNLSK